MNEKEFKEELRNLAIDLYPSANEFAIAEGVGRILRFLAAVDPAKYRDLWRALYNHDATEKEWSAIEPIPDRLEKLAIRLGDEGRYTDENICFGALEIIKKSA